MNAAKQPIALHVLSSEEDSTTRRLHLLMRQRETLRPMFRATWDDLSHHFDATELDAWAGAVLQLANVNAGPACLIAYWDASKGGADARRDRAAAGGRANGGGYLPLRRRARCDIGAAGLADRGARLRPRPGAGAVVAGHGLAGAAGRQNRSNWSPRDMNEILAPGTIDAFENFVSAACAPRPATRRGASLSFRWRMLSPAA